MSQETALLVTAGQGSASEAEIEAQLTALVLNSVTSAHSRRSYRTGLMKFFLWTRCSGYVGHFSKAMVGEYRCIS